MDSLFIAVVGQDFQRVVDVAVQESVDGVFTGDVFNLPTNEVERLCQPYAARRPHVHDASVLLLPQGHAHAVLIVLNLLGNSNLTHNT